MKHVILIGFMGAGKTSVGKRLASHLQLKFTDTDDLIVQEQNMPVSQIFEQYGEPYFRELETKMLRKLLLSKRRMVISVGGGLPMTEKNQPILKELGRVVYLQASVETLMERLKRDTSRPLLQGGDLRRKITELMSARESTYKKVADICIHTDEKTFSEIVLEISEKIS